MAGLAGQFSSAATAQTEGQVTSTMRGRKDPYRLVART